MSIRLLLIIVACVLGASGAGGLRKNYKRAIAPPGADGYADYCFTLRNLTGKVHLNSASGRETFSTTWEDLLRLCETLPRYTGPASVMYHWGPIDTCMTVKAFGYVPQELMQWFLDHGHTMVAGGGFYLSEKPTDTVNYGDCRIDVEIPQGIPILQNSSETLSAFFMQPITSKDVIALIGSVVPFMEYRYVRFANWSVVHSVLPLLNATAGAVVQYHTDLFPSLFGRMYPSITSKLREDQQMVASFNAVAPIMRRFLLTAFAAEEMTQFFAALLRQPNTPWLALVPNSTEAEWQYLEWAFAQMFDPDLRTMFIGRGESTNLAWFFEKILPLWLGAPMVTDLDTLLRSEPLVTSIVANEAYLDELQKYPFINVANVENIGNITTVGNATYPHFRLTLRSVSAYDKGDWIKLAQSGFLNASDPVFDYVSDPKVCCAGNKTQLLLKATLTALAKSSTDLAAFVRALNFINPQSTKVVPRWISTTLARAAASSSSTLRIISCKRTDFPKLLEHIPDSLHSFLGLSFDDAITGWTYGLMNQVGPLFLDAVLNGAPLPTMVDLGRAALYFLDQVSWPPCGLYCKQQKDWNSALLPGQAIADALYAQNWPLVYSLVYPDYQPPSNYPY